MGSEEFLEIDVRKLLGVVSKYFKALFLFLSIAFVVGVTTFIFLPRQYNSSVLIMQDLGIDASSSSGLLDNLGGLSSLGFLSTEGSSYLSPAFSERIIKEKTFLVQLMDSKFDIEGERKELKTIIEEDFSKGFGDYLRNTLKFLFGLAFDTPENPIETYTFDGEILQFNEDYYWEMKKLEDRISVEYYEEDNTLRISVLTHDPVLSANLVNRTNERLQKELSNYQLEKLRSELTQIDERLIKVEASLEIKKNALAKFLERNLNIVSERAKFDLQNLRSDYDLDNRIYRDLVSKKEEIGLQLIDKTPIYHVIEPSMVPIKAASPNLIKVMMLYFFLAIFIWVGYIFFKEN